MTSLTRARGAPRRRLEYTPQRDSDSQSGPIHHLDTDRIKSYTRIV